MERSELDPGTERSGQGGDTGLEEPMWNLGLEAGGTDGGGGSGGGESLYPERPGEPNCNYYLRTGFCGYGERCRFNHPRDRGVAYEGARAGGGEYPERDGQPVCQYFMRTGSCKFGPSCKYHHPRHEAAPATAVTLNIYGYPLRVGENDCSYYMKTGQCKFGITCKFHHPQPANIQARLATSTTTATIAAPVVYPTSAQPPAAPPQQYGVVAGGWQVARPPIVPGSYVQGPYGPMLLPSGVVPFAGWTLYPASVNAIPAPATQSSVGGGQLYGIQSMSAMAPAYTGPYPSISSSTDSSSSIQKEPYYPERPGQPECQHYLRTGECKYGPSCRYHHPPERTSHKGAPTCTYFMQHGVCKFGPTCKFNHPMGSLSYSPSASSLSDMPVAPYPVGSSVATLAPSSSSSDLRTEVISGSDNSSGSTVLAKSGYFPESGTQQPGHSSTTQASPSSTGDQGGNVHASS